ncbi:hypothetical protein ABMA27_008709 [Loxostege sticticalis]|uniref:CXXC-type domain-containing protein n=1 Tax=Loxostege sticticalis TaxID=481309 RepID=A0ABR3HCD2_LOXSC
MSKLLDTCGRWGDKMGKLARDKLRAAKTACKCFSCRSMEGNDDAEYGPYPYPEKSMFRDGDLKSKPIPAIGQAPKLKDSNVNCHNCHNCTGCIDCNDCNDCGGCITCNQCNKCTGCITCTNCKNCKGIINGHNRNCVTNSSDTKTQIVAVKSNANAAIKQASSASSAHLGKKISTSTAPATTLLTGIVPHAAPKDSNVNCHNCHNCKGCIDCNDCNGCAGCINCNKCNKCEGCIRCVNCKNCIGVIDGHNRNCVTGKAKTGATVTELKQRNPDTKATCGNYLTQ